MKVRRQRANFLDFGRGADQNKLVIMIESSQRANHVADISAHAKFGHPPDVDGNLHRWHLTIERAWVDSMNCRDPLQSVIPSEARDPGICRRRVTPTMQAKPRSPASLRTTSAAMPGLRPELLPGDRHRAEMLRTNPIPDCEPCSAPPRRCD